VCGRFTLTKSPEEIETTFGLDETPRWKPRFNIAPGQDVATIHQSDDGRRELAPRRWGLVPQWAKDVRIGSRLINARSETADAKPSFRDAMRRRRCLLPADGFYEWAASGAGPRQPYYIVRPDRDCFALAGLYERWRAPEGDWLETCTVLTTRANAVLAAIHARMPVILPPSSWEGWLDPEQRDPARLRELLAPRPEAELEAVPVSLRVNRPQHDDPECIAPVRRDASA
jgi:putative SOS response-associated peptidase YedK